MEGNGKNVIGPVLIVIGLLMIVAAGLLTGQNLLEQSEAEHASNAVLERLLPEIEGKSGESITTVINSFDRNAQGNAETIGMENLSATGDVPDYALNPGMDMPSVKVDGDRYIGVLVIPGLKLELPVMKEWGYPNLKIAPCRYEGSAYQGDLIICAHNYDRHFGRIKNLSQGDEILLFDVDGNRFAYQVSEMEILKPYDINGMKTGSWDLTLFTCTIGGATRVTVRCQRTA